MAHKQVSIPLDEWKRRGHSRLYTPVEEAASGPIRYMKPINRRLFMRASAGMIGGSVLAGSLSGCHTDWQWLLRALKAVFEITEAIVGEYTVQNGGNSDATQRVWTSLYEVVDEVGNVDLDNPIDRTFSDITLPANSMTVFTTNMDPDAGLRAVNAGDHRLWGEVPNAQIEITDTFPVMLV